MKQSPNDSNTYQAITLDNGLRVLLIQNKKSSKSAAALAVNVGHFSDPEERQGLAHFLEHMLFLGTEKYPEGSEYQKFISEHAGSNNAWTATEHTCFFFDIHHLHFSEALNRFGQFFSAPLLSDEFVNNERKNVDAEFELKLKDDIRRLYDVHKETINQAHPFAQFSVGNLDTLADRYGQSIRAELLAFYQQYYCAQYMTLALEGPQSHDELAQLAQANFSAIPSTTASLPVIETPLYLPEHQGIYIRVKPVKKDHQLIISFAMPSIDKYYQYKPEAVLAYLIGHEGAGSILSRLKSKQWAMGLTAGSGINGSNFKDFNISISLTEQGEQHIDDIVETVFTYIELLKSAPIPEHYYFEKQTIAELSFLYHEQMSPLDSVSQLVINMQYYPSDDYIFGDYVMKEMCHEKINELLTYLNVDNLRVIHISQQVNSDKNKVFEHSFWYQVPYSTSAIPVNTLNFWRKSKINDALFLPPINTYIVSNPKIHAAEPLSAIPQVIEQESGLTVWYKQDSIFKVPKGYIYISIDSPLSVASPKHIAMTRLLVDMYGDSLIEENYDAELAGIHYHLYAHQGGVTLQLSGISEKQSQLLSKILESLKHHHLCDAHFTLLKDQMISHWRNAKQSKSISQLFSHLSSAMQQNNPSSELLSEALSLVSFEEFSQFSRQIFTKVTIEMLIHGNWLPEHAHELSHKIKDTFAGYYDKKHTISHPILDIAQQGQYIFPKPLTEQEHAGVIYYSLPDKGVNEVAITMLTSHLLSPLFFQVMRTEKQYGYLVGVGYIPIGRYPGIAFYIQSPHTEPKTLITAMDEFLLDSLALLESTTEQQWKNLQQGLTNQLKEKDHNLRIKSQRFWSAICNNKGRFNYKEQVIDAILSTQFDQVKSFIQQYLMKTSNPDRVILISDKANNEPMEQYISGTIIHDLNTLYAQDNRKY